MCPSDNCAPRVQDPHTEHVSNKRNYAQPQTRAVQSWISHNGDTLQLQAVHITHHIVSGKADDLTKKSLIIKLISNVISDNFSELLQSEKQLNVVNQIKDYINAGNGMGMTLDDFAKTFFYDKFYLERKFKEAFGLNLIEYRNKKRMELAKHLLKLHSVSEVSELVGYQSIYAFSRAYKSFFGYAPSKKRG